MKKIKHPEHIPVHILLIIGSIFMLFPFLWMLTTSVKSEDEILSTSKSISILPDSLRPGFLNSAEDEERIAKMEEKKRLYTEEMAKPKEQRNPRIKKPFSFWDNYSYAWNAQPFYRFFLNTLFVTITVTAGSLFFASMSAYAFAFFNFPFKDAVFMMMLGTMMIPQQALLIPNYIFLSELGWINTYLSLIVPWLASAYSVFFLRQFFLQLPKDLYEAARIDGCSRFQFYYKIVLPLSKPPMVTLGIFCFLANWNSFVWPLIVTNDTNLRVIQVGLSYFSSEAGTRWGPLMAASTMTILPLVIMYFLAQRQFVESQAMTGMKE
ncbi:MAG: multiple sugar transport system permease protein [Clostridiales bacterium]|jgi:multiple sugar transport system permease protein|nr:multiple sugar transport system permease protein [Clostridiales bacterium]MDN5283567.1 multiple sugar transport system permease protein [Candidatus Ozemobacter sp.]